MVELTRIVLENMGVLRNFVEIEQKLLVCQRSPHAKLYGQ